MSAGGCSLAGRRDNLPSPELKKLRSFSFFKTKQKFKGSRSPSPKKLFCLTAALRCGAKRAGGESMTEIMIKGHFLREGSGG
jgi:hypothetical protein